MVNVASAYVVAPQPTPLSFGLLDSANVIPGGPHLNLGVQYEPEYCGASYGTVAACEAAVAAQGTISISVSSSRVATITGTGEPSNSTYIINWGDGQVDTNVALDTQTNTYAAAGEYHVLVTNSATGYTSDVWIHVNTASTSGPFTANAALVKTDTDGVPTVTGDPFAVYHMAKCRMPGQVKDAAARARRSLLLGEGRAVEAAIEDLIVAAVPANVTPVVGTAVDIVDGLALLESYAATNYGGVPSIHVPRAAATRLASRAAVLRIGDHLETVLGSLVIAGAGYDGTTGPTPATTPANSQWLFATGPVSLWQGDVLESGPQPLMTQPASAGASFGMTNEYRALVERPYVGAWECFQAAVLVKTTGCCA